MTHFATPERELSAVEAELTAVLDSDAALTDGFEPLGLVLIAKDLAYSIVLLALTTRLDVDRWWSQ